ncbi:MAG: hypothetical protein VKJ02_12000 [Snowella sp.]|nr:hypothetical protein [Snowella sp.]
MPTNLCLSLVTFPLLVGLGISQTLAKGMIEFGQASEEIFRGDRLPILPFPEEISE